MTRAGLEGGVRREALAPESGHTAADIFSRVRGFF